MNKLIRVRHYLGVAVTKTDCPSVFRNPSYQSPVRLPLIDKVAVETTNLVDHTSGLQGRMFVLGSWEPCVSRGLKPTLTLLLLDTQNCKDVAALGVSSVLETTLDKPQRIIVVSQDFDDLLPLSTSSCIVVGIFSALSRSVFTTYL